jgi:hypothetical protein
MSMLAMKLISASGSKDAFDISKMSYEGGGMQGTGWVQSTIDAGMNALVRNRTVWGYGTDSNPTSSGNYQPHDVHFNADGSKAFILNSRNGTLTTAGFYSSIMQVKLSTPYTVSGDIGAYNQDQATTNWFTDANLVTQAAASLEKSGFTFKPDGTSFWIADRNSAKVREVQLTTAWDLSTVVSYTTPYKEYATGLTSWGLAAIAWNPNGNTFNVLTQQSEIWQYTVTTPFDITTVSAQTARNVSGESGNGASTGGWVDMSYGNNGLRLLVTSSNNIVLNITLSSAYDTSSTLTYASNYTPPSSTRGAHFSPNGTKVYFACKNTIEGKSLGTAYDLTGTVTSLDSLAVSKNGTYFYDAMKFSASPNGQFLFVWVYPNAPSAGAASIIRMNWGPNINGSPRQLSTGLTVYHGDTLNSAPRFAFGNSGTTLYYLTTSGLHYFTLGSAYDIYDATYVGVNNTLVSATGTGDREISLYFKPDGTKLFAAGDGQTNIREYALSTPWNPVGSLSLTSTLTYSGFGQNSLAFSPDGTKIFTRQSSTGASQWAVRTLNTAWTLASGVSSTVLYDLETNSSADPTIEITAWQGGSFGASGIWNFAVPDENDKRLWSVNIDRSTGVPSLTSWSAIPRANSLAGATSVSSFAWGNGGMTLIVNQFRSDNGQARRMVQWDIQGGSSNAYRLDKLAFKVSKDFIFVGDTYRGRLGGVTGATKFYLSAGSNQKVLQYNMSTDWDVSTIPASENSAFTTTGSFTVTDFQWSSDGAYLYILDKDTGAGGTINQYTAATAWTADSNINQTPTNTKSFSAQFGQISNTGTQVMTDATNFSLSTNGKTLFVFHVLDPAGPGYVSGNANAASWGINGMQYTLSTAFNISTAVYDGKTLSTAAPLARNAVKDSFISDNGRSMYLMMTKSRWPDDADEMSEILVRYGV